MMTSLHVFGFAALKRELCAFLIALIISLPVHRYSKHSQNPTLSKTSRFELGAQNEFLCAQKSFSVCSEIESSAQLSISVHTNQNLLAQPELCARASE